MRIGQTYTARERIALSLLAAIGLLGLNGVFLAAALRDPGVLRAALGNPVALAFILEALALVGLLAYLMRRWGVARVSWPWFVMLSLVGGLLFAVPLATLWGPPKPPPPH